VKVQTAIPFVDTNIIPTRNAGIGSLLWDLQNPHDLVLDGQPLLNKAFAFIDVGVSRPRVSTTLKNLLETEFGMDLDYVATELPGMVPYAYVTNLGERGERIRGYLSSLISSKSVQREIADWHYVVNVKGKVSSVTYCYYLQGNEVWEAYFMGRSFMVSGQKNDFSDPTLNELVAPDVAKIESMIDLKGESSQDLLDLSRHGYKIEINPLEAGLNEFGISLQKTDVPDRINDKQNVLFLGNVLNNYTQNVRSREFHRITANMADRDIIIIQVDEPDECSINVLQVKVEGGGKTYERLRWINTYKLEISKPVRGTGSWQTIQLQPQLEQIIRRLVDCLDSKLILPGWSKNDFRQLAYQYTNQVFRSFFRALPVEATLRIAILEVLRSLPLDGGLKGRPVFKDEGKDLYGGTVKLDLSPIVSEEDLFQMKTEATKLERTSRDTACHA